jgi:hypothetical protein
VFSLFFDLIKFLNNYLFKKFALKIKRGEDYTTSFISDKSLMNLYRSVSERQALNLLLKPVSL